MSTLICQHCGKVVRETSSRRRQPAPSTEPVDTSAMTVKQLYAYYKKIAPLEDVRFMLRVARLSDPLRIEFEELEQAIVRGVLTNRAEIYRHYVNLQDKWRGESNARERADKLAEQAREAHELDLLNRLVAARINDTPAADPYVIPARRRNFPIRRGTITHSSEAVN